MQNSTTRYSRLLLAIWGASLLFLLLASRISEPPHRLEYVRIENQRGLPLRVLIYFPEPARYPRAPAAIVIQAMNNPPEYARLLVLELVEDGFVVLTFDWRGRASAENRLLMRGLALGVLRADLEAVVAHLRARPEVDPQRIVLAGHSVGGTLALETAIADPRIAAVASIGMEYDATPTSPRNLLWAHGLYDEFRSLGRMRGYFRASVGASAPDNTGVGDFGQGTGRRLGVSPTSDHFTELQDWRIHREVVTWFCQALGLPARSRGYWMETRALLRLLAGLAALAAAILTLRVLAQGRRWVLRIVSALGLLLVVALSRVRGPGFLPATEVAVWLVLFGLVAGFIATRREESLARGGRRGGFLVLASYASILLTLVVNTIVEYVHEPRYLIYLPEFALRHPLDALYAYFLTYARPVVFSVYDPQWVSLRLWVYAVLGFEILYPGGLLALLGGLKKTPARAAPARPRPPLVGLALLGVLLLVLGAIAWLRFQQGFLTPESARVVLRFLLRYAVLPLVLFSLFRRWGRKRFLG